MTSTFQSEYGQYFTFKRCVKFKLRPSLHGVGVPGLSGVGFFCFHALGDTKQKKPTPLDRGPPLHVNRVSIVLIMEVCVVRIILEKLA